MRPAASTDDIARTAARLLVQQEQGSVEMAINRAMEELRCEDAVREPSHALVRKHAQGMSMQQLGEAGYDQMVLSVLRKAEEVMMVFEEFTPILAGRAAKGQVDGGVTLHVRVYTKVPIGDLAQMLVDRGYEEPTIDTVATRWGRLNRILFADGAQPVIITRCLPTMESEQGRNLFKDEPVAMVGLEELRERL